MRKKTWRHHSRQDRFQVGGMREITTFWKSAMVLNEEHLEGYPVSFFSLLPNPMKMITFAGIKTKPDSLTGQGLPGINTTKVVLTFD